MKKLRYALEGLLLTLLFGFFKILPADTASNIGGWIGRVIGPKLAASRKALRHLNTAIPGLPENEQKRIIKGMWENLGRVIAEYPHLETISMNYTTIKNRKEAEALINKECPLVFFGAHLANWEVNGAATLTQLHHPIDLTYRAPNNPITAKLLDKARTLNGRLKAFPKSQESGRLIMKSMKNNGTIGILIDQKYNEGIEAQFFGKSAMTNPVFVQLCQRYKCPLIPVRNERVDGCRFKLTPYPAIPVFNEDNSPRDIIDVIEDAHRLMEGWIKERPEQWMWLHKRWKE